MYIKEMEYWDIWKRRGVSFVRIQGNLAGYGLMLSNTSEL